MRCFYHPEREAVGLCKACSKGLCVSCAADLGHGIACKGRHEEAVTALHSLIARNARLQAVTPRTRSFTTFLYAVVGILATAFGYLYEGAWSVLFIMGVFFLGLAVVQSWFNRKVDPPGRAVDAGSLQEP